jgi:hypothetical protein
LAASFHWPIEKSKKSRVPAARTARCHASETGSSFSSVSGPRSTATSAAHLQHEKANVMSGMTLRHPLDHKVSFALSISHRRSTGITSIRHTPECGKVLA